MTILWLMIGMALAVMSYGTVAGLIIRRRQRREEEAAARREMALWAPPEERAVLAWPRPKWRNGVKHGG